MARGWESKSIEDQINAREAESQKSEKKRLDKRELERLVKRDGMLLDRARTVSALESVKDERYRHQLQRALAHLDSQIADMDK